MSQCGDCNRPMKNGETLYNIGTGRGIWVCEDCFQSSIDREDMDRIEEIKEQTKTREVRT